MKQTLLLIGCGDIALRSAPLLRTHYRLIGLCRHLENAPRLRQHGITPVFGDLDSPKTLNKLAGIAHAVLHLAPPPNHGKRDIRTTNLLASLTKRPAANKIILPQRLIYISTSGVYGDCNGALTDETCPIKPRIDRSIRRADAEKQVRNWGLRNYVSVSILRVPGIYAAERLPLKRYFTLTGVGNLYASNCSNFGSYTRIIKFQPLVIGKLFLAFLPHSPKLASKLPSSLKVMLFLFKIAFSLNIQPSASYIVIEKKPPSLNGGT